MLRLICISFFVTFTCDCYISDGVDYYLYAHDINRDLIIDNYNEDKLGLNKRAYAFIVHGENEDSTLPIYEEIVETYKSVRTNFSYILVDWSALDDDVFNFRSCKSILERCEKAGHSLMTFIRKHDIPPNRVHLIGVSRGAHVAAAAAKQCPEWFLDRPYKLTALDPSSYCFESPSESNKRARLSGGDAVIVNVLHTNTGHLGLKPEVGTLDFYANGGTQQPSCPKDDHLCNHRMSVLYFNESIVSNQFAGEECDDFGKGCRKNEVVTFGPATNLEKVIGKYYFNTNPTSPYGKGHNN